MPKLELDITTQAEVVLKPSLVKQLKLKLDELRQFKAQAKALKAQIENANTAIETYFADADEYEALENGVRISTPFGDVPVKLVKGKTAPRLNMKKLMNTVYVKDKKGKFVKATPGDLASCYDPPKDKKPYLGVWLPGESDQGSEDE